MRLELSARAEREIYEHFRFGLSQYGFRQADDYMRQLRQRTAQLADMPYIGIQRDDVKPGVRLLVFKAHNILCRVDGDRVLVIRVLHRTANWVKLI